MYNIVVSGTRQEHSTFRKYGQKLLNLRCPCHIYCEWDCKVAGVWTVVQIIIISIRSESQLGSAYMQYWSGLYNNIDTHLSTTLLVMPHQLHQRRCSAWHGRQHCSRILNTELFFAFTFRWPNIFAAESLLIMSPSLLWCEVCVYNTLTYQPWSHFLVMAQNL